MKTQYEGGARPCAMGLGVPYKCGGNEVEQVGPQQPRRLWQGCLALFLHKSGSLSLGIIIGEVLQGCAVCPALHSH